MTDITPRDCFTIADIHNIRYENYEKIKNMSHNEIIEKTKEDALYGLLFLKELKDKIKQV